VEGQVPGSQTLLLPSSSEVHPIHGFMHIYSNYHILHNINKSINQNLLCPCICSQLGSGLWDYNKVHMKHRTHQVNFRRWAWHSSCCMVAHHYCHQILRYHFFSLFLIFLFFIFFALALFREMADQLRQENSSYNRLDNWKQGQGTTIKW